MRRELVLAGLLAAGLLCVVRAHGVQVEAAARLQDFAGAKGCLSGIFRSAPSRTPLVVQSNSAPAKFVVQKKSQVLAAKKSLKKAAKKNKDPSVPKKLKAKEPSQKRGLSKQERKAQKKALKQAKQQKKAEKKAQKSQKPAAFGGRCACPAGETCCVGTKRKVQICQHKGGVCCPHSDFCCKSGHSCVLTDNGAYQCVRPGEKELPEAMLYKSFKPTAFVEVQRNVTFAKRSANTTSVRRAVRQAAKKAAAAAAKKAARAAIKAARRANKVAKQETKRAVKQATKKAAKKAAAKVARQAAKKAAKKAKAKAQKKQAKVAAKKAAKAHKKKLAKAAKKMAKGIKRKGKGKKRKGKKIPDYEWLMAKSRQQDLELLDRTKGKVRNHLFRANVDRLLAFFPGKGDPDKRLDRHIERAKRRAAALKKRLRADNKLVGAKRLNKLLKKKHKGRGKAPKKATRASKKRSKAVARQKFRQVNMPAKKAVGVEPVFNFH